MLIDRGMKDDQYQDEKFISHLNLIPTILSLVIKSE